MGALALDLGELTVRLSVDNDLSRGLAEAKREVQTLPPTVQREMVKVAREMDAGGKEAGQRFANGLVRDASGRLRNARGQFASDAEIAAAGINPVMERRGRESGGVLAKGIQSGLIRNSPLIVAGIGAALAAGAPAVLAGAGVLFGGIGAVAAAQYDEVREAWVGLGQDLRDGAVADAGVLVPVFVGVADQIGAAFQRLRPQLRDAFEASAPLIQSFTGGIVALAEGAMPGLVRAVQAGQPVFQGLESFLSSTGTGLTGFLDALSAHAPAAGAAFAALGDIMGDLLPILGELLGQGAELASIVLPPLAAALGEVADALSAVGPVLPAIAAGFLALRTASAVSNAVASLSTSLTALGASSGLAATGAGKAATSFGLLGRAVPILALAMAGLSIQQNENTDRVERYTQALLAGGEAAAKVHAEVETQANSSAWERFKQAFTFADEHDIEGDFAKAEAAARGYAGGQSEVADAAERSASAIERSTAALAAQTAQALAAANSDLAYRMSVDATEDAVAALAEAQASGTATADQLDDASLAVERAMLQQAEAARQAAFDTSTASSEALKNAEADGVMLAELLRLRDTMGSSFPAALNTTIERLQASTNAGAVAQAQFNNLGLTILSVPNSKTVIVSSTTPEQIRQLEALGYTVRTLPDGRVEVTAATSAAEAAINYAARTRTALIKVQQQLVNRPMTGEFAATGGAIEGGRVVRYDSGGPVFGPGGPTDDLVPALGPDPRARYRLSNGEHVWTAAEVRAAGGQEAVADIRRAVLAGARGYAGGGGVASGQSAATSVLDRPGRGALFHADQVNLIEGTPEDVAQRLAYEARLKGW